MVILASCICVTAPPPTHGQGPPLMRRLSTCQIAWWQKGQQMVETQIFFLVKLTNSDMENDWLKPQCFSQSLKIILTGWAEQIEPTRAAHSPAWSPEPGVCRERGTQPSTV